jgi:hypothetical protein
MMNLGLAGKSRGRPAGMIMAWLLLRASRVLRPWA